MPADQPVAPSQWLMVWNETKWMRWVWRNGGMKFVVGEHRRNPEKNLPRPRFVHQETHMDWPRRELGTPAVGGANATRPPKSKGCNRSICFSMTSLEMCVPRPTHCTITCFGFYARWIDGVECDLFSNHAPLGQTTLRVGWVSVYCTGGSWG